MGMDFWLTIAAIFLLLILSGFFSGSETALTAASRARMHALEQDGHPRAGLVNRLLAMPERMIGALLLGNNLVNILASALATTLFLKFFGDAGVAYATLVMTTLVVIFSEILPKTYALANADKMALRVAPLIRAMVLVFGPLSRAIEGFVGFIIRSLSRASTGSEAADAAHEELRGAIDLHHRGGAVIKGDRDMLGGILDLSDLEVADVMVHRTKMVTANLDSPRQKLVDDILKSPNTRIPLWQGQPDNIVGILNVKDMLRALARVNWDVDKLDILELCSDPWFVPDSTGVKSQLNTFLKRKAHFALVVDEYGEVQGLVTLEDILEEIVGQIADEHDIPDAAIRPQADGTVNVDGTVPVRDLNRHMDWNLPDEEATTIAGLVIHEAQTIPEPGQAFTFYGFRFEILRKQRNRITALRITKLPGEATGEAASTGK